MTDPNRPVSPRAGSRRALVATLLVATLAIGAAARMATESSSGTGTAPARTASKAGVVGLEAGLDRASVLEGGDGMVRLELVLRGQQGDAIASAVPTDLVVVLDRSGSMQGQPIETALGAVRELIAGLAHGDRFALVSYASAARVDISLEVADPGTRGRWAERLGRVQATGGTNLASGLDLAHSILASASRAGRAPRVIVLSDGLANQGDYSLPGLRARAARALGGEYVLSSVGIGAGFDETVMSALADAGTGNFYYLPDLARLAGVFDDEFAAARDTVARALAVRIEPGPGVRVASAAGYPLVDEDDGGVRFHPGDLFAGQERRIWLLLHAPTEKAADIALGAVHVDYATPDGERHRASLESLPELACVANDDAYYASFDADLYRRANQNEALGELKQSVAKKLKEGRQEEAVAEVDAYRASSSREQLRALGSVDETEADAIRELRDTVAAPSAAAPHVRNHLGKALLESGRDAQRAGAKR